MTQPEDAISTVHLFADQLRQYATHFERRDWQYTRDNTIKHIRLEGDWSGYDNPVRRLWRCLRDFVTRAPKWERDLGFGGFAWKHPIAHTKATLQTQTHLPDGVLDNGGIITHWEETGEYLQYVQPSVGELIADLMEAHPDLPEVQAVAIEMKRINDDYGRRINESDASGAGDA